MARSMSILGLAIVVAVSATAAAQTPPAPAWQQADEQAVRSAVETFARAYNAHDAKAAAALFTADGEAIGREGRTAHGRAAIEQVFARAFQENPETRIEISVASVRFLGPTAALEEGSCATFRAPGEPAQRNRYLVFHGKQGDVWRMASAHDFPDEPPSAEEQLKQLDWLVGDWVSESPEALVVTSCRWSEPRRYLLSEFTVQVAGRPAMKGSQRIGWDSLRKTLRSWVFDSEGGFAEGTWTRDGDRWVVKTTGVTRDGKPASATSVTTRTAKDRMTWQSRDRSIGGERLPDVGPVVIVRTPPKAN